MNRNPHRRGRVLDGWARWLAACGIGAAWCAIALPAVATAPSGSQAPGTVFRDCPDCPEMVVVPAGDFTMGSPPDEPDRANDEGPRHHVSIPHALAVSRFEVTRGQYEAFVRATGRTIGVGCRTDRATQGVWTLDPVASLRDPAFVQTDDHPVVCVSWNDAQAYVGWLNGQVPDAGYRLLSEAEWEYLARAGSTTAYPWGPSVHDGCAYMNGVDRTVLSKYPDWEVAACDDGALNTAPVGSYRPNAFGLHDMIGNVGEWVQDCSTGSYETLAADSASPCERRTIRGGSWGSIAKWLRVADRFRYTPDDLDDSVGIRVARSVN